MDATTATPDMNDDGDSPNMGDGRGSPSEAGQGAADTVVVDEGSRSGESARASPALHTHSSLSGTNAPASTADGQQQELQDGADEVVCDNCGAEFVVADLVLPSPD